MTQTEKDTDLQLLELLSERAKKFVASLQTHPGEYPRVLEDERRRVNALIDGREPGLLAPEVLKRIYNEMFTSMVASLMPYRIAYLGPRGTFSNLVVRDIFSESAELIPCKSIPDIFRAVEREQATQGVVPVENSIEGGVTFTLDELIETDLSIIGEKYFRVTMYFLSKSGDLKNIKRIYTHPQPLGQCKSWIRNNCPHAAILLTDSTSVAAEKAAADPESAAIASKIAADLYGLTVLAGGIDDTRLNITRFFILGRGQAARTGGDKTSIICAVKDKPGALLELLSPIRDAGINMTKIESRPDKKKMWAYNFFIDFLGHRDDEVIRSTLAKIKEETIFLKILGSYPAGN